MKLPEVAAWAALSVDGKMIRCPGDAWERLPRRFVSGARGNALLLGGEQRLPQEILKDALDVSTVAVFADRGCLHRDAARLLRQHGRCVVFTTKAMPDGVRMRLRGVADVLVESRRRSVDLICALAVLSARYGVRRALCVCSPALLRALALAGVLSRLHIEFSPRVTGGARTPTLLGVAGESLLARSIRLRLEKLDAVGEHCRATYAVRGTRKILEVRCQPRR